MGHDPVIRQGGAIDAYPVHGALELGQIGSTLGADQELALRLVALDHRLALTHQPAIDPQAELFAVVRRRDMGPLVQVQFLAQPVRLGTSFVADIPAEVHVVVSQQVGAVGLPKKIRIADGLALRLDPGLDGERTTDAHGGAVPAIHVVVETVQAQSKAFALFYPGAAGDGGIVSVPTGIGRHLPLTFVEVPLGQQGRRRGSTRRQADHAYACDCRQQLEF